MKKNIFSVTVVTIAFAFIFIACGGEEPKTDNDPTDEEVITDTEPTDDVEPVDNEEPDDPEIDDEPVDEDIVSPSCEENPTCQEVCKNFLDMEGSWSVVIPTTVSGEITLTLSVSGENCKVAVTGKWEFAWEGTEINQMSCVEYAPIYSFFSLQEMEGEKLVIRKAASEENCESGQGTLYKFEKIQ